MKNTNPNPYYITQYSRQREKQKKHDKAILLLALFVFFGIPLISAVIGATMDYYFIK